MNAISLRFDSDELEEEFSSYLLSEGLWKNDKRFFWFVALVNILALVRAWGEGHRDLWVLGPQFLGWLIIAVVFLVRWMFNYGSGMPWWRDWLVGAARIWLVLCIALVEKRVLKKSDLSEGLVVSMIEGAWSNHAFQLILVALALRLKFKWHFLVQCLMVGVMLYLDGGAFCKHIIANNSKDSIIQAEDFLDLFSQRVLTAMYSRFGNATIGGNDVASNPPCRRLSLFVHLFGGLGLVSYGIWLLERCYRADFLKSIENDPNLAHVEKPNMHCNVIWMLCNHMPIIGIALALTWEFVTIAPQLRTPAPGLMSDLLSDIPVSDVIRECRVQD